MRKVLSIRYWGSRNLKKGVAEAQLNMLFLPKPGVRMSSFDEECPFKVLAIVIGASRNRRNQLLGIRGIRWPSSQPVTKPPEAEPISGISCLTDNESQVVTLESCIDSHTWRCYLNSQFLITSYCRSQKNIYKYYW